MEQGLLVEFPQFMSEILMLAGFVSIRTDRFEEPALASSVKHPLLKEVLVKLGQEFVETCTAQFFSDEDNRHDLCNICDRFASMRKLQPCSGERLCACFSLRRMYVEVKELSARLLQCVMDNALTKAQQINH